MAAQKDHVQDNEIAELRRELAELKEAISEIRTSTTDLLAAWRAAGVFVGVIKWAASIASGAAIIWAAIHGKDFNK